MGVKNNRFSSICIPAFVFALVRGSMDTALLFGPEGRPPPANPPPGVVSAVFEFSFVLENAAEIPTFFCHLLPSPFDTVV